MPKLSEPMRSNAKVYVRAFFVRKEHVLPHEVAERTNVNPGHRQACCLCLGNETLQMKRESRDKEHEC